MPPDDRQKMFDWSNRMVGSEDPEYQLQADMATNAAMELYAYASELFAKKQIDPRADLMSVLTTVEVDGERLSPMELELFFLLLTVAGNETDPQSDRRAQCRPSSSTPTNGSDFATTEPCCRRPSRRCCASSPR